MYCEKTKKYAGMLEVYQIEHHQIEQIKNLIKAMCYITDCYVCNRNII